MRGREDELERFLVAQRQRPSVCSFKARTGGIQGIEFQHIGMGVRSAHDEIRVPRCRVGSAPFGAIVSWRRSPEWRGGTVVTQPC